MRPILVCCLVFLFIYGCVAPPVTEQKKKKHDKGSAEDNEIEDQAFDVEYKRYLQEVVNILEKDDDFKSRLEKADPDDIKSGKIAKDIEFVNHNVRTKLDELKRQELERLRHAAMRQYEHDNGIDRKHMKIPAHLDPNNPHTFEAEDLRKLIVQTTKDLEDADRKRKEEFKEYEMRKELEYQEQLKRMDEKNREAAEKQHQELLQKHKQHKPLHHPGSKPQFEEVWEEQDHLSPEDFNPKTFFHLHDLDGNGYWDANEVKALFKKELDKMYDPNAPEDDMKERMEEMERMREHVFNETDQDKDQLISFKEFLEQTKKQEFEKDEGWEPLDQHQQYTPEEYQQYANTHEEEIRRMIEQGLMPPPGVHPNAAMHHAQQQGYHPQDPHHLQQAQQHHDAYQQQLAAAAHHQQQQHAAAQMQYQQQQGQGHHVAGAAPNQHHPQQQQQFHHDQFQQGQIQGGHHPQQQQLGYQQQQPGQVHYDPQQHQQQQQHLNAPVAGGHHSNQQEYHPPPPQGAPSQVPPAPVGGAVPQQAGGAASHVAPPPPAQNNQQPPPPHNAVPQQQQQAAAH